MFWGEFRRPLAALDRCTLNKGAFAFKTVRGDLKWSLKGGSTANIKALRGSLGALSVNKLSHIPKLQQISAVYENQ